MEMESERDEYDRRWNKYNQDPDEWRSNAQTQTGRHESGAMFSVRSVPKEGSGYGNRFVRINGLNETNPICKLERMLREYYPTSSRTDEFGCIRRNPRTESNPLLCNLANQESTQLAKEFVLEILYRMLDKIPEHQIEFSTIRGIGSHRITRFDLVETEVIQARIKVILIGAVSGRVGETLKGDEVSVYDEGTKEYIESNRLLDYIAEFLWKANGKADRPVLVNGLNESKPSFNYNTHYGERVETREYRTDQYNRDYKREIPNREFHSHSPLPNSFRISRNRPQHGDEYHYKPSNLSESFTTHPANNEIGLRGLSPSQTIRGAEYEWLTCSQRPCTIRGRKRG